MTYLHITFLNYQTNTDHLNLIISRENNPVYRILFISLQKTMLLFYNDNAIVNNIKESYEECRIVRNVMCLVIIINVLLICMPGMSYCYANDSNLEIDWDYLTPIAKSRDLDTVSLHILNKIAETKNRSVYRGITITRPQGNIIPEQQPQIQESSAVGIGPVYMVRNEKYRSGKLSAVVDMSGGFIVYNKKFPAGGEYYNFMWRIGPQFIYKFNQNSSVNIGYMLMHVSNGLHSQTHNPSYNAHGVSLGFATNF